MGDEPVTDPEEFDTLGDFVTHIVDKTRKGFLEDLTKLIDAGAATSDGPPKIDPPTPTDPPTPKTDPPTPPAPKAKVRGDRKFTL